MRHVLRRSDPSSRGTTVNLTPSASSSSTRTTRSGSSILTPLRRRNTIDVDTSKSKAPAVSHEPGPSRHGPYQPEQAIQRRDGRWFVCATELLGGPGKPFGVVYASGLLTGHVAA